MDTHLKQHLTNNPQLDHIQRLISQQQQLAKLWQQVLPEAFVPYAIPLYLDNGVLRIDTAHSGIAAKLKQLEPRLVIHLQQLGLTVSCIHWRVQKNQSSPTQPRDKQHRYLSQSSINALEQAVQSMPEAPVKEAFKQFIRKQRKL